MHLTGDEGHRDPPGVGDAPPIRSGGALTGDHPVSGSRTRIGGLLLAGALLLVGCGDTPTAAQPTQPRNEPAPGIALSSEHPRYWQLDGEPVFLRGGSKEDNLFQVPDVEAHLDALAAVRGNYIRNTMSSRDPGDVWPFARRADGKYDLEQPSTEYYARLARLLDAASERGVVVQMELWDRWDFVREAWLSNPFRPANNVNYTPEESGLADAYERHPNHNANPFFRSVLPGEDNALLRRYQEAHVDRILEVALRYPNVLYTVSNETNGHPSWGAYWARYVRDAAREAGVAMYTTEMWDARDLRDEQHRRTLDHPALYAFGEVSQNNHNTDQAHWDNLQWARRYIASSPRPLNNVKIYGADTGSFGTTRDGVERFWRSLIGGAASARFHRPESGIGLGEVAKTHLASAALLLDAFDLFRARPDEDSHLLGERHPDEAYASYVEGEQYAVYFPDGGSVELDLVAFQGPFQLRWLDVERRRWLTGHAVQGGVPVTLAPPGSGHWVALVTRP